MSLAWIILGAVGLWALIRLGRQSDRTSRVQWRVTTTVFAAICWGAAALLAVRGSWLVAACLAAAGGWLAVASRQRDPMFRPTQDEISVAEARRVLGVSQAANDQEIQAAYRRLMARAHPDAGGSQGLAERLNAARDRLLKR
ncbi:MAG: DnaJ domain-containing protein [Caulobacterales bacterium]|nr:DnaJ domain-containing protein [Caulobacterales bacterium]